jgi:hypothetical protein
MNSVEQSDKWVSEALDVIGIEPWILSPELIFLLGS